MMNNEHNVDLQLTVESKALDPLKQNPTQDCAIDKYFIHPYLRTYVSLGIYITSCSAWNIHFNFESLKLSHFQIFRAFRGLMNSVTKGIT